MLEAGNLLVMLVFFKLLPSLTGFVGLAHFFILAFKYSTSATCICREQS